MDTIASVQTSVSLLTITRIQMQMADGFSNVFSTSVAWIQPSKCKINPLFLFLWPHRKLNCWTGGKLTGENKPSEQLFRSGICYNRKRPSCFTKIRCSKWFNDVERLTNPLMYLIEYNGIDIPQNILQLGL